MKMKKNERSNADAIVPDSLTPSAVGVPLKGSMPIIGIVSIPFGLGTDKALYRAVVETCTKEPELGLCLQHAGWMGNANN